MAAETFQDIAQKYSLAVGLEEAAAPEVWAAKLKEELGAQQRKLLETKQPQRKILLKKECLELEEAVQVADQEVRRHGQEQLLEKIRQSMQDDNKEMFDFLVQGKTQALLPGPNEASYEKWLGLKSVAAKKWPAATPPATSPPNPRPEDDRSLGQTLRGFEAGQKVFRRYTLRQVLGRGGMGIVWLARDEELEREVALKFLPEMVALDTEAVADLKRETRRGLELNHHHIVRIYDFVSDNRAAAISMEYVDGPTLSALKSRQERGFLSIQQLTPWVEQVCAALDYAHKQARVVHRDLKPANLMINAKGELKIADFGVARTLSDAATRLTLVGGTSGTLLYMSPQQAAGEPALAADDIYALGATLYDLLAGKPPFFTGDIPDQLKHKTPPSISERRKELNLAGDAVPDHWEKTIADCLAKDPAQRPQSAGEVAERLRMPGKPVLTTKPEPARTIIPPLPPSPVEPPKAPATTQPSPGKSRKLKPAGLVLAAAAVVLLGLGSWYFGSHLPEQKREQEKAARDLADAKAKAEAAVSQSAAEKEAETKRLAGEKAAAEAKSREEARLKAEAEEKGRQEAEAKRLADEKADADAKSREETHLKAEAEEKARLEADVKRLAEEKAEAEAKLREETRLKGEAEEKSRQEAEALRLAEEKTKAEAEAKARDEDEAKRLGEEKAKTEAAGKTDQSQAQMDLAAKHKMMNELVGTWVPCYSIADGFPESPPGITWHTKFEGQIGFSILQAGDLTCFGTFSYDLWIRRLFEAKMDVDWINGTITSVETNRPKTMLQSIENNRAYKIGPGPENNWVIDLSGTFRGGHLASTNFNSTRAAILYYGGPNSDHRLFLHVEANDGSYEVSSFNFKKLTPMPMILPK